MCYPKSAEVKHAVNEALRLFYLNDLYLIRHDVHECALTFRLGLYLQQLFSGWDVDCEFNRDICADDGIKRIPIRDHGRHKRKDIVPDIIIHKRGIDCNLLVIEAKKNPTETDRVKDIAKIKSCLEADSLHYCYGLFLDFQSTREETMDASVFINQNGESSLRIKSRSTNENEVK